MFYGPDRPTLQMHDDRDRRPAHPCRHFESPFGRKFVGTIFHLATLIWRPAIPIPQAPRAWLDPTKGATKTRLRPVSFAQLGQKPPRGPGISRIKTKAARAARPVALVCRRRAGAMFGAASKITSVHYSWENAVAETRVDERVTRATLRHSRATRLMQAGFR